MSLIPTMALSLSLILNVTITLTRVGNGAEFLSRARFFFAPRPARLPRGAEIIFLPRCPKIKKSCF